MKWKRQRLLPGAVVRITVLHCLTTGVRPEKCVVRQFRHRVTTTECTHTHLRAARPSERAVCQALSTRLHVVNTTGAAAVTVTFPSPVFT